MVFNFNSKKKAQMLQSLAIARNFKIVHDWYICLKMIPKIVT